MRTISRRRPIEGRRRARTIEQVDLRRAGRERAHPSSGRPPKCIRRCGPPALPCPGPVIRGRAMSITADSLARQASELVSAQDDRNGGGSRAPGSQSVRPRVRSNV
jgi:hypothetical protein